MDKMDKIDAMKMVLDGFRVTNTTIKDKIWYVQLYNNTIMEFCNNTKIKKFDFNNTKLNDGWELFKNVLTN